MRITSPGFYRMTADDYHADPCPEPSLSGSIAVPLVHRSPLHAWARHPRLNTEAEPSAPSAQMLFGSVCHRLLLGEGPEIEIIDADSYTTKAAREARDSAIARGRLPVLCGVYDRAEAMTDIARDRLEQALGGLTGGTAEAVLAWSESGAWCRGMVDWLSGDRRMVFDYKTTSASVRPDEVARQFYDMNYHLKAAFYERGLDVLDPGNTGRRRFIFLFQETEPPYECSLIEPDESGMTVGRKQTTYAIETWQRCLRDNIWPGYGNAIHRAAMPSWMEQRWIEREMADPLATGQLAPGGRVEPYTEKPFEGWTP